VSKIVVFPEFPNACEVVKYSRMHASVGRDHAKDRRGTTSATNIIASWLEWYVQKTGAMPH
jgi:hypothetical protein